MAWVTGRYGWLIIWGILLGAGVLTVVICQASDFRPFPKPSTSRISFYEQEQCEPVDSNSCLFQKEDFWSNYSYLAGGLLVLCLHDRWIGRSYGIVLIYLAFCSAWYHGTLSETGQTMDIAGVYTALLATVAYAFYELAKRWPDDPIVWYLMLTTIPAGLGAAVVRSDVIIFDSTWFSLGMGVVIFVVLLVTLLGNIQPSTDLTGEFPPDTQAQRKTRLWPIFWYSLVLCAIACAGKFTDGTNFLGPTLAGGKCLYASGALRWFQGHAIWHIATGLMFPCLFEFFRAINNRGRSVFFWRAS
jgi:hypothetical protein